MRILKLLTISTFLLVLSCKTAKNHENLDDIALEELFLMMQGSFNSEKQSLADTTYFNISLHMYPIWENKGSWLYVEQAMNSAQNRPYRQRIYEVKRNESGKLSSYVYTLPTDSLWIGKWKTPSAFDSLSIGQLKLRKGCEVILEKQSDGSFRGSTQDGTCKSSLRGASYAMSAVTISKKGIESWDQGFDKIGKQVWGATEGAYIFDKLKP